MGAFQLSMRSVEVDGEDADVDGFDDVFVELLEALELGDLGLEALVELGVLDGDADVAGERFEQLHVFGREEVAIMGAAEADDGDGAGAAAFAVGDAAGEIVVEVEAGGGTLLLVGEAKDLLRVFEEDVVVGVGAVEVEEADVEGLELGGGEVGEAVRGGEREAAAWELRWLWSCSSARKTPTRVTSRVWGRRSTMESSRARRSVWELRLRPNSTRVSR